MNNAADDKIHGNHAGNGTEELLQDLDGPVPDHSFEQDSNEGLALLDREKIPAIIGKLNHNLRQQLKKKKRNKPGLPDQNVVYITVIIVLLLIIISYIILKKIHP